MRKKICFIVSAPATAKSFLCNHIKELSLYYDVYLVANITKENNLLSDLPLTEIKILPLQRKVNLWQDIKTLFLLKKYYCGESFLQGFSSRCLPAD